MFRGEVETDELRRLALQLAIQLPANVADAELVLALSGELLSQWMVERSDAHRRAMRLGWRVGPVEPAVAGIRAPHSAGVAFWCLLGAMVATPVALLMVSVFGVGAGLTYGFAVTVAAIVFGLAPALWVAAMSSLLHNLVVIPPALEFTRPTRVEIVCAVAYVLLACLVPWISARRLEIREAATRSIERAVELLPRKAA